MAGIKATIYETVTDMFITAIEAGWVDGDKWVRPWSIDGNGPMNPLTGKHYNGLNRLIMMLMGVSYAAGRKQWFSKGHKLRKGAKHIPIVTPMFATVQNDDGTEEQRLVGFKGGQVFPHTMVTGWEPPVVENDPTFDRDAHVEAFIEATGAVVHYGGNVAAHYPQTNEVTMPHASQFTNREDYYGTILHELVHWTGVDDRLGRRKKHLEHFDTLKDAYAFEELVAELGASFLCADLGVHPGFREDHGEYIAHWLKQLRTDNHIIFTAASQAQQAVAYLHKMVEEAPEQDTAAA